MMPGKMIAMPRKSFEKKLSWIEVDAQSDFPIQNLPFGIFETDKRRPRAGVAIGNFIVDLVRLHREGFLPMLDDQVTECFRQSTLNDFIGLGKQITCMVRERVGDLLDSQNSELRDDEVRRKSILVPMEEARMLMPVKIGDYTDFYSSKEHATNVGSMFRDPQHALPLNWTHLPVAYHGRASSIVPSGAPIRRPKGQVVPPGATSPEFAPTACLDFELEVAFITGQATELGEAVSVQDAEAHIFGFVLFNDWSARDIQKWEYVPLGPFLGKSFGSSISPWVVTIEALEPFRTKGPEQLAVLPYLKSEGNKNYDLYLEVGIVTPNGDYNLVCESNFKYLYWNVCQQLAHQTINGCNINVGDLYASGTISGPTPRSWGSMMELTWNGTKPIQLKDGSERKYLQDGDTVVMKGFGVKNGYRIGFGELRTFILPAL